MRVLLRYLLCALLCAPSIGAAMVHEIVIDRDQSPPIREIDLGPMMELEVREAMLRVSAGTNAFVFGEPVTDCSCTALSKHELESEIELRAEFKMRPGMEALRSRISLPYHPVGDPDQGDTIIVYFNATVNPSLKISPGKIIFNSLEPNVVQVVTLRSNRIPHPMDITFAAPEVTLEPNHVLLEETDSKNLTVALNGDRFDERESFIEVSVGDGPEIRRLLLPIKIEQELRISSPNSNLFDLGEIHSDDLDRGLILQDLAYSTNVDFPISIQNVETTDADFQVELLAAGDETLGLRLKGPAARGIKIVQVRFLVSFELGGAERQAAVSVPVAFMVFG